MAIKKIIDLNRNSRANRLTSGKGVTLISTATVDRKPAAPGAAPEAVRDEAAGQVEVLLASEPKPETAEYWAEEKTEVHPESVAGGMARVENRTPLVPDELPPAATMRAADGAEAVMPQAIGGITFSKAEAEGKEGAEDDSPGLTAAAVPIPKIAEESSMTESQSPGVADEPQPEAGTDSEEAENEKKN